MIKFIIKYFLFLNPYIMIESLSISEKETTKTVEISKLTESNNGETVRLRGFIKVLKITRNVTFITLRELLDTVQCIVCPGKEDVNDRFHLKKLSVEAYVEIIGKVKLAKPQVKSCTKKDIEIDVLSLELVSGVVGTLPFSLKDASATEAERTANPTICKVSNAIRFDNRFLDFRMPHTLSIIKLIDGAMNSFRTFLRQKDFIELKTTKIIQSGSEGGSNLFSIDYFGTKAYLAQSPQLYKQMAIAGGMKRVFEVGHVYRAEVSNTNRYLSEFTGLDIEMELDGGYRDAVKFIYSILKNMFDTFNTDYKRELDIIREYNHFEDLCYGPEPVIITHREAVDLLKSKNYKIGYEDDFSREAEKVLGGIVKEIHGVDIFCVVEYPALERAFYTYVDRETGISHSYDFILRGEEILSGAERCVNYNNLKEAIEMRGINTESIQFYLDCFKFGVPPHAGCGMGLERLMKSYLNFDDIRFFSLYPRDPTRIFP